jgi:hypothetical protein
MKQENVLKAFVLVVLVIVIYAGSFFLGDKHALQSMTIKRVAPTQLANAMKGDYFYSKYGENTLLISGTVDSAVRSGNGLTVTFKTSSSYHAVCHFDTYVAAIRSGQTITVLTEAAVADRQPAGVLLHSCIIP